MIRAALIKPNGYPSSSLKAFRGNGVKTYWSQSRTFFFGSSSDDGDNKGDGKGSSSKKSEASDAIVTEATSSNENLPSRQGFGDEAPRYPHLTALPVISKPLFPGIVTSVTVTDEETINALNKISSDSGPGGYIGTFLRKKYPNGVTDGGVIVEHPELITDASDLYNVGTLAQIHRITHNYIDEDEHSDPSSQESILHDGKTASVLLLGHRRIDLLSIDKMGPPIDSTVSHWERLLYKMGDDSSKDDVIRALSNEILKTIRELAVHNPLFRENATFFPTRVDSNDPYRLADFAASLTTGSAEDLQAVLHEKDPEIRLNRALELLSKERELSKLQQEIKQKVEEKMTESQRRYMLTEQLKSIKKELGMEKDDKEELIGRYRKKIAEFTDVPKEVQETMDSELEKISTLEKNSSEFNVTRTYLDWLTSIPWGKTSKENLDIGDARKILNRDHYGMDEVKDTILAYIAIGKLKGGIRGKILCLSGPPGVGKTSIAKSVANALGREFFRFSVGGLSDVSEIKGHRRTYVGAMPGKLAQCLKTTGTMNPLVLIDEIDKLGTGYRGDPSAALLELLDPSQNSSFIDHFLDVPLDMSKVLFMCTANDLGAIPGPLLDRMEIVILSGYDVPEKIQIAQEYLVPKALQESGLIELDRNDDASDADNIAETISTSSTENQDTTQDESQTSVPESLRIERSAIEKLVRWYCREAGVRSLNKYIDKISRKLALQVVAEAEGAELTKDSMRKSDTWCISENNLEDYVGKPIFTSDRLYDKDPLPNGIVMGLAWTSMGGSALYIETQAIRRGTDPEGKQRGGGMLKVTGQLGSVMKESTEIAYTVSRAQLADIDPSSSFFDENDIHMHVPEGATPKDGPSAGVTMTTAMLSLALGKPIRNDLAMTGEISLTGKVLPIGGIKEKVMAARRAGIKCIILPDQNKRDFDEIPEYLKEGLDAHFASDYPTVYDVSFS
uniref:Lon protease homolog n=1 Tax=Chaetoceros debilis TaxID=122233 RepID=A0A7S3PZD5_9STRA